MPGHAAAERPQQLPGAGAQAAPVLGAAGQDVHEGRLAVDAVPAAGQETPVVPLAVPQRPAASAQWRQSTRSQSRAARDSKLAVAEEGGGPQSAGDEPGGFYGAEAVQAVDGPRGGMDKVRDDAVVVR